MILFITQHLHLKELNNIRNRQEDNRIVRLITQAREKDHQIRD